MIKKRRIIDFHTHLGDIFHDNQNITFKKSLQFDPYSDPFADLAAEGYTRALVIEDQTAQDILIEAGQLRTWQYGNLMATSQMLDETQMDYIVSLPVLPNTSFLEALAASKLEPRILPFTSADFSLPVNEMKEKLKKDIRMGARGLKLHPILQNVRLNDERTYEAVEVFGELNLPVTAHCGINDYYKLDSPYRAIAPKEYGELDDMLELLDQYPQYILIPAHAGGDCGWEYEKLAREVKANGWQHVYTDTSFKSAKVMRELVELFGEDKILFASDYPFDGVVESINVCEEAFGAEKCLADRIFYKNSAGLLGIL